MFRINKFILQVSSEINMVNIHGKDQSTNSMSELIKPSASSKSLFSLPEACVPSIQTNHCSPSSSTCTEESFMSDRFKAPTGGKIFVRFIAILFLFCVTLCSIMIYLFIYVNQLQIQLNTEILQRKQHSNDICFPCADLKLGPFPEDNQKLKLLDKETVNGADVCCARTAEQTTTLFNLLFEKKQRISCAHEKLEGQQSAKCNSSVVSRPQSSSSTVAAHLMAGTQHPLSTNNTDNGPAAIRNWSLMDPVAHVHGLQVQNDRIRINSSGLYFVYSQVYFVSSHPNSQVSNSNALYHFVYRYNVIYPNGGEELLLRGVRTKCWEQQKKFDDYTSYTAGAIYLNSGDELFVSVSNISEVSKHAKSTFFGLFKLP